MSPVLAGLPLRHTTSSSAETGYGFEAKPRPLSVFSEAFATPSALGVVARSIMPVPASGCRGRIAKSRHGKTDLESGWRHRPPPTSRRPVLGRHGCRRTTKAYRPSVEGKEVGDGAIADVKCLGDSAVPDDHREPREQDEPGCGRMRKYRLTPPRGLASHVGYD